MKGDKGKIAQFGIWLKSKIIVYKKFARKALPAEDLPVNRLLINKPGEVLEPRPGSELSTKKPRDVPDRR